MCGINMAKIQANAIMFDAEQLHRFIMDNVNAGMYDTCLEALSTYAEEHDVDMSKINNYISPALRCILHKEATERNLLTDSSFSSIPDSLFD